MKPKTLKEIAEAGLVLGFDWVAKNKSERTFLHTSLFDNPPQISNLGVWSDEARYIGHEVFISDFPSTSPEASLLKLTDILETSDVD